MSSKQLLALHRYSSATFKYRDTWAVVVRGNYVFDRKSGPTHRLDLTFKEIGSAAARSLPHGIIGQSFTTNAPRRGKQDVYPASGRFATSAQAEGAIEGDASMYEVAFPHATTLPSRASSMSAALADGDALVHGGRGPGVFLISSRRLAFLFLCKSLVLS